MASGVGHAVVGDGRGMWCAAMAGPARLAHRCDPRSVCTHGRTVIAATFEAANDLWRSDHLFVEVETLV